MNKVLRFVALPERVAAETYVAEYAWSAANRARPSLPG
jgi:hypothetical protein